MCPINAALVFTHPFEDVVVGWFYKHSMKIIRCFFFEVKIASDFNHYFYILEFIKWYAPYA